jgi:hypothetical protein
MQVYKRFAVQLLHRQQRRCSHPMLATDPPAATTGAAGAWSQEAQTTLTNVIGRVIRYWSWFGATGGGGNAGCIGRVFHLLPFRWGKGSFACRWVPLRRYFDIDFVVHEIGHQLGANHTFHMSWKKSCKCE